MTRRYMKFSDRAPIINNDRLRELKTAQAEKKADKESRRRRKAENRQRRMAKQQAVYDEEFVRIRAAAAERGMTLRQGNCKFPIHWMFEDAATGARLLNYYPKSKTGCYAKGKGFHVGDVEAAMNVARSADMPTKTEPKPKLVKKLKGPTPPKTSGWKNYQAYQRSQAWQAKREVAFEHHGRKCSKCESVDRLCVIRLTYDKPYGQEDPASDLKVLCQDCWTEERNPGTDFLSKRFKAIVRDAEPASV